MTSHSKNIITTLIWISKGYAKNMTIEHELTKEEVIKIQKEGQAALSSINEKEVGVEEHGGGMIDYQDQENMPQFSSQLGKFITKNMGNKNPNFAGDDDDEEDDDNDEQKQEPHNQQEEQHPDYFDQQSDEQKEDYTIRKSDSLIAVGTTENGEYSNIQVYVYDEQTSALYVHHQIMLSSYPLAIEWLPINHQSNTKGNFAIVGTFLPQIQIWNLDVTDAIQPSMKLGGAKSSKSKKQKYLPGSHVQGVVCLSLNQKAPHVLASGSEDTTVKIWDLTTQQCTVTFDKLHSQAVQKVLWSPLSESAILTAGLDRKVHLKDIKQNVGITLQLPTDIQGAAFNPKQKFNFALSFDDGSFAYYDVRQADKGPIFHQKCFQKSCSAVAFCPQIDGLLATAGSSGEVKIFDVNMSDQENKSKEVGAKNMKVGQLFDLKFDKSLKCTLATGGTGGELAIWDLEQCKEIVNHFKQRI